MATQQRPVTRIGLITGALLLAMAVARPAAADSVHYASPDGTGALCTQTDPCAVQTAIATAAADDFVYLMANKGIYNLTGDLSNLPNTPIRLRSFAGRAQLWFTNGHLAITGGQVDGISVHGDASAAAFQLTDAIGSRMIVQAGSGQAACQLNGATLADSVCLATANSGTAAATTFGDNVLRNDTLVGGTAAALAVTGSQSGCGCSTATEHLVNVIARSAQGGKDINVDSDGQVKATVKVRYSNFATTGLTGAGAPSMTVIDKDSTDQTEAPVFDTAIPGDTHEAASSPTIDAGKDSPDNGIYDIDANARTMGTRTDIGADEFVAPPDTTITGATINHVKRKATLTFASVGPATGFQCQLTARPSGKAPAYTACTSPKTYRHLARGKWRFRVRAVGTGGTDTTPAVKRFRI